MSNINKYKSQNKYFLTSFYRITYTLKTNFNTRDMNICRLVLFAYLCKETRYKFNGSFTNTKTILQLFNYIISLYNTEYNMNHRHYNSII